MMTPNADGPDWSHHNVLVGTPDPTWSLVAHKCSEGGHSGDGRPHEDRFRERWEVFRTLGIRYRLAYHVLVANVPIKDQANNILTRIAAAGGLQIGEAIQSDWENWLAYGGIVSSTGEAEFRDRIHQAIGRECTVTYSGVYLADSLQDNDLIPEFQEWRQENPTAPWWLANYRITDPLTDPRSGWNVAARYNADLWQWTSRYLHPSVQGGFDMNHVFPSHGWMTLDRICGYNIPPITEPTPEPIPQPKEDDMPKIIIDDPVLRASFTLDGVPLSEAVIPFLESQGWIHVTQDHPWWRAAILHRNGSEASRLYGERI